LTIISTAIPVITQRFHSLEDVGWYGSAMFFPIAATQSVWGKCYKYFDMKLVFLTSILIFEVGSLLCGNRYLIDETIYDSLIGGSALAEQ
jgi:MFS transporter, DHA2 family, glioxin efflux transporter